MALIYSRKPEITVKIVGMNELGELLPDEVLVELYELIELEEPVSAFGGESKLMQHSEMNRIKK